MGHSFNSAITINGIAISFIITQQTIEIIIIYPILTYNISAHWHINIQLAEISRISSIGHIIHIFRIRYGTHQRQ